ncbi:hypothetical protein StoSoilB13_28060 (plasmid) [Arthrobacter sp. StoSoilB13]|nr:hypothetical protein StoSoilB13_28060 [Arthrobacter sp. StoSoilB13]
MKTTHKIQTAAAGLAVLLALTACGGAATGTEATEIPKTQNTRDISEGVQPDADAVALLPKAIKDKGELTVAMDLSSPPMTFLAEDNKTPIGVNPDLARLVAKKLGPEAEVREHGVRHDHPRHRRRPLRLHRHHHVRYSRAAEGAGHDQLSQGRLGRSRSEGQPAQPHQ